MNKFEHFLEMLDAAESFGEGHVLPEFDASKISSPIFTPNLSKGQIFAFVCGARPQQHNPRTSDSFRRQVYERYWDTLRAIDVMTVLLSERSHFISQMDVWFNGTKADIAFALKRITWINEVKSRIDELKQDALDMLSVLDNSADVLYNLGIDFIAPLPVIQFQAGLFISLEHERLAN